MIGPAGRDSLFLKLTLRKCGDDGTCGWPARSSFLRVRPGGHGSARSFAAADRCCSRPELAAGRDGAALQPLGLPVGLSRVDAADTAGGVLLLDPLGAAALPGGQAEPGLSLVLWLGPGRHGAAPFDVLGEPARALSRQRYPAQGLQFGASHRTHGCFTVVLQFGASHRTHSCFTVVLQF